MSGAVTVLTHPLALAQLSILRSESSDTAAFRAALQRLSIHLLLAATGSLETRSTAVTTPLAETQGQVPSRPLVLVPILRAALGLVDGMLPQVPDAVVAHIGIARNEDTAQPEPYYAKLPPILTEAEVLVIDPMLATGGSACEAIRQLKAAGARRLTFACVVSCPEGLAAMEQDHPDVPVVTAAIDDGLNERSYIVPGLGDAGDRYFGT